MEAAGTSDMYYDGASTIFSPDGRLFQVEYAREAIKKGATTIGMKYADGVLLMTHRQYPSRLTELTDLDKIVQIDDHIGCAFSGLVADARILVDLAREESQVNRIMYNEQIPVKVLVDILSSYKHMYTQFDGVRPFGVALLIAGVDTSGKHLYSTDPSGAFIEYKATCEGKGSSKITAYLNSNYSPDLSFENATHLVFEALHKATKKKINEYNIEIAVVDSKNIFRKISFDEIKQLSQDFT